jgi:FkbM family methyltransferase
LESAWEKSGLKMDILKGFKKIIPSRLKVLIKSKFLNQKEISEFYQYYFSLDRKRDVIQVGANDGEMGDPLREYLKAKKDDSAILIEPHPFYAGKLRKLYEGRGDIRIEQVACGNSSDRKDLYFIPPALADAMNGDGPMNNWAHGQGSFDKSVVIRWIGQNSFRGKAYVDKIPFFIDSIQSIETPLIRLKDLDFPFRQSDNLLLVLDVQGFELEVLKGLDWDSPPRFIVFEDDLDNGKPIGEFLVSKDYRYLCGSSDKVFCKKTDPVKL